jgi:hypothetical protein
VDLGLVVGIFIGAVKLCQGHQGNDCTVYLVASKSRLLEPLAFEEYCRFDTSDFF